MAEAKPDPDAVQTFEIPKEECSMPVGKGNRWENPWSNFVFPSMANALKFFAKTNNNSKIPSSKEELDRELPVKNPDLQNADELSEGIKVTWIGHATVLVQFDGISILTDPIFSDRCSPLQFMGPKRYRKAACTIEELPRIDAVVISHTHYDHLDLNSVKELNKKYGPSLHWFVPLGVKEWMNSVNCETVTESTWWEEHDLNTPSGEAVKFVFTPAAHWSGRKGYDRNQCLWGSWSVLGPTRKFFFAGDTGYCAAFKQIGNKYGPFDLAAIPIGAYCPRFFMKSQHINPQEAVEVHLDIQTKKSIGIHWGTFALSNEHYLEPPKKIRDTLEDKGMSLEDFFVICHGESKTLL